MVSTNNYVYSFNETAISANVYLILVHGLEESPEIPIMLCSLYIVLSERLLGEHQRRQMELPCLRQQLCFHRFVVTVDRNLFQYQSYRQYVKCDKAQKVRRSKFKAITGVDLSKTGETYIFLGKCGKN